ncbi:MAG: LCP family protein, partial [Marmoricola sp.]
MPLGPHDPNDGTPQGDGEDFDWLYGERGNRQRDDATRMMPTVPRSDSAQAPRSRFTPPPITPGPDGRILQPQRPSGPRPPQTRIKWKRVLLLFVVLPLVAWLAFLIAVPAISWGKIERVDAFPSGARPSAGQGTNYLLVGSDSRRGLSADQRKKLGLGNVARDAGRTDTIMILHLGSGPSTLVSIPRDSWVHIPGHGIGKINSAFFYGGPKLLVQTVEQDTGLRIDHFVEIGLGGFVNAVDAVGGVRICPTSNLNDKLADLHIKKGCQGADGATALAWARSRHAFALGDIAREQHQREIVHEVGQKAKSIWTFVLPWRYIAINNAAVTGLRVDKQMSIWNMISFARAMGGVGKT